MKERYRDRSGRIVTLTYDELLELGQTKSVVVDIAGEPIELYVDGHPPIHNVERTLPLGEEAVERLYSGFISRFYNVLDVPGDGDLVLMAEDRADHEFEFTNHNYREIKSILRDDSDEEVEW